MTPPTIRDRRVTEFLAVFLHFVVPGCLIDGGSWDVDGGSWDVGN